MPPEFNLARSETFVEVARARRLLSDEQAKTLLEQSTAESLMSSWLAVEIGMLKPVEAEIVEAFTAPKDLAPGYELLDVLGYGALGVVYRARQPHLQRDVAIKAIMQTRVAQKNVAARFQQEGAAIGRFQHPNVVSAFDSGSHRNRLFLVMELVDGSDLRKRLERGPMDITTALSIVRQTASGLAHALAHQIIHRDIKPGNLILTDAPAGFDLPPGVPLVKIADFGLARLTADTDHDNTRLTLTGSTLGTPMYCAPEQMTGDDADHRADIYALGATLFRMLTGHPPFKEGKVFKIIAAKVTGQQPQLDLLPPSVTPEVRQLLFDMIQHDPDKRVPDYETLIARVDELLGAADPPTADQPSKAGARRETKPNTLVDASEEAKSKHVVRKRSRLAILSLVVLALFLLVLPFYFAGSVEPTMVPSGWESHLFDGETVTGWTNTVGLWHGGTDAEGGTVLVGKGSAVRRLPPPPAQPGVESGFGVRVGIDLQKADSAEVHFGRGADDPATDRRLVVRLANDQIALGTQRGIDGEFKSFGRQLQVPPSPDDAPNYHEIRIELHGPHWFVYFNGKPLGDTNSDPAADNGAIELVARGGSVHFEGPSIFGLRPDDQPRE